jgi:hypothetical protein
MMGRGIQSDIVDKGSDDAVYAVTIAPGEEKKESNE